MYTTGQVTILIETQYKNKPGTYFKKRSMMAVLNVDGAVNALVALNGKNVTVPFESGYNERGAYVLRLAHEIEDTSLPLCDRCKKHRRIVACTFTYSAICEECAIEVGAEGYESRGIARFAQDLGAAFCLTPAKKERAQAEESKVFLDAGTYINRIIRPTSQHMGYVRNQGKVIQVAEVYDLVSEQFYWATVSYARDCEAQGQIVFW